MRLFHPSRPTSEAWGHYVAHPLRLDVALMVISIIATGVAGACWDLAYDRDFYISYYSTNARQAVTGIFFLLAPILTFIVSAANALVYHSSRLKLSPVYTLTIFVVISAGWLTQGVIWGLVVIPPLTESFSYGIAMVLLATAIIVSSLTYCGISIAAIAVRASSKRHHDWQKESQELSRLSKLEVDRDTPAPDYTSSIVPPPTPGGMSTDGYGNYRHEDQSSAARKPAFERIDETDDTSMDAMKAEPSSSVWSKSLYQIGEERRERRDAK